VTGKREMCNCVDKLATQQISCNLEHCVHCMVDSNTCRIEINVTSVMYFGWKCIR
jgi:hypothetical protein